MSSAFICADGRPPDTLQWPQDPGNQHRLRGSSCGVSPREGTDPAARACSAKRVNSQPRSLFSPTRTTRRLADIADCVVANSAATVKFDAAAVQHHVFQLTSRPLHS